MLEELTKYSSFGPVESIEKILKIVQMGPCSLSNIISMVHLKGYSGPLHIEAAMALLIELGVCTINQDGLITYHESANENIPSISGSPHLGRELFRRSLKEGIIRLESIEFDEGDGSYFLTSSSIKMRFSQIRNFLISTGILTARGTVLEISSEIVCECEHIQQADFGGMTPEQLIKKLEENHQAGERAEAYALEYEKKRLGKTKAELVKQVSRVSVSAGFDIASFENVLSVSFDRLIEVKAYSHRGFYLSSGEIEASRKYGDHYYLYIIDLNKINEPSYVPCIIPNPIKFFETSTDWRAVPDTLRITKLNQLD